MPRTLANWQTDGSQQTQMCTFCLSSSSSSSFFPPEPRRGPQREPDKDFVMKLLVNLGAPVLSPSRHEAQKTLPLRSTSPPSSSRSCHIFLLRLSARGDFLRVPIFPPFANIPAAFAPLKTSKDFDNPALFPHPPPPPYLPHATFLFSFNHPLLHFIWSFCLSHLALLSCLNLPLARPSFHTLLVSFLFYFFFLLDGADGRFDRGSIEVNRCDGRVLLSREQRLGDAGPSHCPAPILALPQFRRI